MHDIPRIALGHLRYLLKHFPCVVILGARQVGKTTLLKQLLPKASFFDLEKRADSERIRRDPDFFLSQQDVPIVLDEAQRIPELFPALRVAIDQHRNQNGRFLISGSSSPHLLTNIAETLAGRVAFFELSGFSLAESWNIPTSQSVYQAISERKMKRLFSLKKPSLTTKKLITSCLLGGYPEVCLKGKRQPAYVPFWMENYYASYLQRDVRSIFPGLQLESYQKLVQMLAVSSGTLLNASDFGRSLNVSQPTIKSYFQIAEGTFVWRMLPSYQKNIRKRTIKMPKGYMRDCGLLNHLLHIHTQEQLQNHPSFGRIWEGFVLEELLKGFAYSGLSVKPYYYRTNNQAEIDLILEDKNGILPVEIKAGTLVNNKSLVALRQFIDDFNLPFGLVINNGEKIEYLAERILQLPASYLSL